MITDNCNRLINCIMPMMFNVIVGVVANYNYTIEHISVQHTKSGILISFGE